MAATKPDMRNAVLNFCWTLAFPIQKKMVAYPMPEMPKDRTSYTANIQWLSRESNKGTMWWSDEPTMVQFAKPPVNTSGGASNNADD